MLSGVRRLYRCYIGGGYHKLVILQTGYQVSGVEVLEDLDGLRTGHLEAATSLLAARSGATLRRRRTRDPATTKPCRLCGDQAGEDGREQILIIHEGVGILGGF